jgi:hypothetical protein
MSRTTTKTRLFISIISNRATIDLTRNLPSFTFVEVGRDIGFGLANPVVGMREN